MPCGSQAVLNSRKAPTSSGPNIFGKSSARAWPSPPRRRAGPRSRPQDPRPHLEIRHVISLPSARLQVKVDSSMNAAIAEVAVESAGDSRTFDRASAAPSGGVSFCRARTAESSPSFVTVAFSRNKSGGPPGLIRGWPKYLWPPATRRGRVQCAACLFDDKAHWLLASASFRLRTPRREFNEKPPSAFGKRFDLFRES